MIDQRDVYMLPYTLNNRTEDHPFIVLSTLEANKHENTFIAVMMTSSEIHKDDLSFPVQNEMFEENLKRENCHIRMHLIFICIPEDIVSRGRINKMKQSHFRRLMKQIGEMIFKYNFTPIPE